MTSQGSDQNGSPFKVLVAAVSDKSSEGELQACRKRIEQSKRHASTLWGRYGQLPEFAKKVHRIKADTPQEAILMALEFISGRAQEPKEVVEEALDTELVEASQEQAA